MNEKKIKKIFRLTVNLVDNGVEFCYNIRVINS